MIYTGIGNDLARIDYREDPLAKTIAPNYQNLSMSAWGIPEMNDIEQFNPEMEKNIDTVPEQFTQYVQGLNDLKSKVQGLMKTGIDITKPSLDPKINAAHLEFLQKFNNITALGKQLQQSREIRKAIESAGTKDVYTNAVPNEILTSTDQYVNRPDLQGLKSLVDSRSRNREFFYNPDDLKSANQEIDNALEAIDQWEAQAPKGFEAQYKRDADLARAQIKAPYYDKYKKDKLAFEKQKQSQNLAARYAALNSKRDQLQSDFPLIVSDLINGNPNKYGSLLKGVVVGKTFVNTGTDEDPKNVEIDDVIQDVKHTSGGEAKRMFGQTFKNDDGQPTTLSDNDKVVVIYKTSGPKVIRIRKADGSFDMAGIQTLNSLQAPYDRFQVTPTTDFSINQNEVVVDPNKSYKQFTKPNTSTKKVSGSMSQSNSSSTPAKTKISW